MEASKAGVSRWLVLLFVVAAVTAAPTTAAAAEGDEPLEIAFTTAIWTHPFFQHMNCGARAAAHDAGDVEVIFQGSDTIDAEDQLAVYDAVMLREPDGVLLVPFDSQAFIEPVAQTMADGTPVVTVDGQLNEPIEIANIRTDNHGAGALLAEELAKDLPEGAIVGVMSATPTDLVQNQRADGFIEKLSELRPDVALLPTEFAGTDVGAATDIAEAWILANPDLAGIFTTAGFQAEGSGVAIENAGLKGVIKVYSFDTFDVNLEQLRDGVVDGLIGQSPFSMGYDGTKLLIDIVRGNVDPETVEYQVFAPFAFVTRDNVDSPEVQPFLQFSEPVCEF